MALSLNELEHRIAALTKRVEELEAAQVAPKPKRATKQPAE